MVELELNMWLKPEDVTDEMIVWFENEGRRTTIPSKEDKEDKIVFEIGIILPTGEKRLWTINPKSQRAIAQAYSTDTAKWVNRPVNIFKVLQIVFDKEKEVIYARTPTKEMVDKAGMNPFNK